MVGLTTVAITKERNRKLGVICQKGSFDKSEFLGQYIDAFYTLMVEARPASEKISITPFEIDLAHGTIKQSFANLFNIDELPTFIQDFYRCQKRIEDLELSSQPISKEILLKEGFSEADIDILLKEREKK